jgi:hypothetical protein
MKQNNKMKHKKMVQLNQKQKRTNSPTHYLILNFFHAYIIQLIIYYLIHNPTQSGHFMSVPQVLEGRVQFM